MTDVTLPTPWYRQPWPWLLMAAPASAVLGGLVTLWLAASSNNAMVVDDYYREGRAINQQLARDERASALGLSASLQARPREGSIVVELNGTLAPAEAPEALNLRLVHATESALDAGVRLVHVGEGRYRGAGVLPASGHWIVHVEDPERSWRLVARAERFDGPLALHADPVAAGGAR